MTVTRCFTFGYDHIDPVDNSSLAETYVRITADDRAQCRELMVRLFGNKWAFEYGEDIEQDWAAKGLKCTQRYQITRTTELFGSSDRVIRHPIAEETEADDEEAAWRGIAKPRRCQKCLQNRHSSCERQPTALLQRRPGVVACQCPCTQPDMELPREDVS